MLIYCCKLAVSLKLTQQMIFNQICIAKDFVHVSSTGVGPCHLIVLFCMVTPSQRLGEPDHES